MPLKEDIKKLQFRSVVKMFNLKKETMKKNIFLVLCIIFCILTLIGAILCFMGKVNNVGYAIIPMLIELVFNSLYRNSKKAIEENSK